MRSWRDIRQPRLRCEAPARVTQHQKTRERNAGCHEAANNAASRAPSRTACLGQPWRKAAPQCRQPCPLPRARPPPPADRPAKTLKSQRGTLSTRAHQAQSPVSASHHHTSRHRGKGTSPRRQPRGGSVGCCARYKVNGECSASSSHDRSTHLANVDTTSAGPEDVHAPAARKKRSASARTFDFLIALLLAAYPQLCRG